MAAATRTPNQIMAMKSSVLFLSMVAGALAADVDISKLPPASDKKGVTYDKDIKAIFEKSCFKCHGPEKQKGKLRLDSLAAALKGGEDGKILEPGNSAKSTIVHAVARLVEDDAMPPADKGEPLSKEQVGLIRAWIDQGAK
jgi:mono/diheme cytochrome c family protein